MLEAQFASPSAIWRDALQLLLPPIRETVDEYAAAHRLLPARSGTGTMPWSHDEAPYLIAPMRDLTSYQYTTEVIVGPGQCGKTAVAENALLHAVARQARNILWYMQTDAGIESYVKSRVNPMIEMHEVLSSRIGQRPEDNGQHFKKFIGMWVQLLSATYSNLINKSAPLIIADEWDAWVESLGDPKALLDVRRQYYGRASMLLAISHADRARGLDPQKDWQKGIMSLYRDSTRFMWYWPCPHCGAYSSPAPLAKRVMTLEYQLDGTLDEIEQGAHLKCAVNGCIIEDRHRRAMNLRGKWVGVGQEIDEDGVITGELAPNNAAGYWIVGVMSAFLLDGIGGLARDLVKAEREFEISGDATTLKEVTVKKIGVPYTLRGPVGSIDAEALAERALSETQPLGVVPEGVRFLTCWIDVQVAHFEVLVRGWGVDKESWVIDKSRVPADTATDATAWYNLLEGLLKKRWPLQTDAAKGMGLRALGFDSQGAPGTWDRAGEVWRKLRATGFVRNYGNLDGRDVWSVIPTQGTGRPDAQRLRVNYPDNQRKDKKQAARGNIPVAQFQPDQFKDNLAGQLRHTLPGPGYVHIPAALRSKEPPHVNFEQLVSEVRAATGRWTKPHQGVRNEMLDLMVGTHVLAHLHGLARVNWNSPPSWAAEQDKNSDVAPMVAAISEGDQANQPPTPPAVPTRRTIGDIMGKRKS